MAERYLQTDRQCPSDSSYLSTDVERFEVVGRCLAGWHNLRYWTTNRCEVLILDLDVISE